MTLNTGYLVLLPSSINCHLMMKRVRKLHFYLGTFFAPTIIFFAFTGALQVFGLQEGPGNTSSWAGHLAEVHTHQRWDAPPRPSFPGPFQPPGGETPEAEELSNEPQAGSQRPGPPPSEGGTLPLQIFVFVMAIGLITSSSLGVYMAFKFKYDRRLIGGLLVSGTLLPVLLLVI